MEVGSFFFVCVKESCRGFVEVKEKHLAFLYGGGRELRGLAFVCEKKRGRGKLCWRRKKRKRDKEGRVSVWEYPRVHHCNSW